MAKATARATKATLAMTKECADDDALEEALVDRRNHVAATAIGTRRLTSRKRYVQIQIRDLDPTKDSNFAVEIVLVCCTNVHNLDYRLLGVLRSEQPEPRCGH